MWQEVCPYYFIFTKGLQVDLITEENMKAREAN